MTHNIYLYILTAAAVSCLIRVLPLTLIRGKIMDLEQLLPVVLDSVLDQAI